MTIERHNRLLHQLRVAGAVGKSVKLVTLITVDLAAVPLRECGRTELAAQLQNADPWRFLARAPRLMPARSMSDTSELGQAISSR